MDVGPSAAPMMPMDAASFKSNPSSVARQMAKKMPNWAAAPKRNITGWDSRGPKSIMAPMPINRRTGRASEASMVVLNSHSMIPWVSPMPCMV